VTFPIQHQINFLTSTKYLRSNFLSTNQRYFHRLKVIYEHFHDALNKIRKDSSHAVFNIGKSITEYEAHPIIIKGAISASEGHLLLIAWMDGKLKEAE